MADGRKERVQHKRITFALPAAVSCLKHKRLCISWISQVLLNQANKFTRDYC